MRTALLFMLHSATSSAGEAFGVWKLNPARSTLAGNQKCDPSDRTTHPRRGVHVGHSGRRWARLDGKTRAFQDSACSGTQSSRRVDGRTEEILRECANGDRQLILRSAVQPGVLILEITEQHAAGRPSERRLVLEKQ